MRRLLLLLAVLAGWPGSLPAQQRSSQVGGRTSPDGKEELAINLPGGEHLKNTGGRDGAGLCVFTSIELAGPWKNVAAIDGLQKMMKQKPGGG
jgi:hypothetical protein